MKPGKRLTLDDFEWQEMGFDRWDLVHNETVLVIASLTHYDGWRLWIRHGDQSEPFHLDTLDAAQAMARILCNEHMEKYSNEATKYGFRTRAKNPGPPSIRSGVFKVGQ